MQALPGFDPARLRAALAAASAVDAGALARRASGPQDIAAHLDAERERAIAAALERRV